jgi:hypothetical protein
MSENFRVEFPDLPGFVTALRGAPKALQTELTTAAKKIAFRGESLSKIAAPVNTGNLRSSVYSKAEGGAGQVSAIWGASAEYAIYVDRGRGPGKMPPKGALVGWNGVTAGNEFVVRRAIGRRGIKARPFVTKAFNEIKGGFAQREFSEAIKRVLAKIGGG